MTNTIKKEKKSLFSSKSLAKSDTVYVLIRIIVGLLMAYHGWEVFNSKLMIEYSKWDQFKDFSIPLLLVYIGKGLELITGLFFIFGFLTRISALLMAINMLAICFFIGNGKFWYEDQHPFLFAIIAILFFFQGSGKWSFDKKLEN